jgi:hypothetical protein
MAFLHPNGRLADQTRRRCEDGDASTFVDSEPRKGSLGANKIDDRGALKTLRRANGAWSPAANSADEALAARRGAAFNATQTSRAST